MKTYKEWEKSKAETIYEYLNIGDKVDEEIIDYFRDIVPPVTINSFTLQVGEPSDHINGKATFMTFMKVNGEWIYKGDCFRIR